MEAEIPRIDDAGRERFGLDIGETVDGPLKASPSMVRREDGPTTLQVAAALQQATVSIPEIHWREEPGTDRRPSLLVELAQNEHPLACRAAVLARKRVVKGNSGYKRVKLGGRPSLQTHIKPQQ